MDYNILFLLSNILESNNYRTLLMDFNNILNRYIPYNDSTIYLIDNKSNSINDSHQLKSFRYVKGRLYDDLISYENIENTLFEYIYLNKESFVVNDLSRYNDFYKNMNFKELGYEKVIGIPLLNGLKVYGVITLKFKNEVELDLNILELAIEILNSKLSILNVYEEDMLTLDLYKQVINKEKIQLYNILKLDSLDESMRLLIKGNHDSLINQNKNSCIFSLKNNVYRQVKLSETDGYLLNITKEVNTHKKVLKDVYYDRDLKIYNKNKLYDDLNNLKEFTLIDIKYDNTYYLDVKKVIINMFKHNYIYYVEGDLLVLLNESDKRKLKKIINSLELNLNNIMTLAYNIGVLIYPKDLNNKDLILNTLKTITESNEIFYDKNIHFESVNELVKKINIVELIKENKIDLSYYPIYDLNKNIKAYYVYINDLDNIEDKRIELSLLKLVVNRVKNKDNLFLVNVSDELINKMNAKDFFTQLKCKNICFIFNTYNEEYFSYVANRVIKIGYRGSIEDYYKFNFKTDYFITTCIYDNSSNIYFDMLGRMEGLKITTTIFNINKKEDYNYLLENQVGLFMTNKYINESEL